MKWCGNFDVTTLAKQAKGEVCPQMKPRDADQFRYQPGGKESLYYRDHRDHGAWSGGSEREDC